MSAVVELGFSAAPVFTGIDRVEKRLSGLDQSVQKFGRRGGIGSSLGNVSAQLQDIAVQLQGGTRASLVFAQQGSQMLSAFGPAGAVAGAVAAIGSALWMAKEQGREAFRVLDLEVRTFDSSMSQLLSGSVEDLLTGLQKVDQQLTQLKSQRAEDSTTMLGKMLPDSLMHYAVGFGLPVSSTDANPQRRELENTALENRSRILDQIAANSREEVKIAELRAQGMGKEADAMERSIKLRRTLAGIESGPSELKDRLQSDAIAIAAAEERRDLLEAQKQIEEQRSRLAFDEMSTQRQMAEIGASLHALRVEEYEMETAGTLDQRAALDIEGRRLNLQQQLNQLKNRAAQEAERAAAAAKSEADEAARANDQRRTAVLSTAQEFKLLEARATGRKRAIEDAEREVAIEQRRDRLMRDNGLGKAEAEDLATRMQNMQERADNGGRAGRIRGVQRKRLMGGVTDLYDLQRGPSAFDRLQQSESAFDKLQRTPSAFDLLQDRAAQDRLGPQNARNATEPAPARPIDANEAVNRIITLLPQAMADALTK
jgi:hypothetical protein